MRQIFLSVSLILLVVSFLPVYGMYIGDPEEPTATLNHSASSYLIQKFMLSAALHASGLNADQETQKAEEYCRTHVKKSGNSLSLACPDSTCDSRPSSAKCSESALRVNLLSHWFATRIHQEKLFDQASELIADTKEEAKRKFAKRKPFVVNPFPAVAKKNEAEKALQLAPVLVPQVKLVIAPVKEVTYFLLEASGETPGIFATYRAHSREEVLDAYLRSKMIQGKLDGMEYLKQEVLDQTKKQRMVQGDAVKSLVCPAQGCKHQVNEAGQNALAKLTLTLLVHYAAYHKHESPEIRALVALIAPSFVEARKNIEKGEKHA